MNEMGLLSVALTISPHSHSPRAEYTQAKMMDGCFEELIGIQDQPCQPLPVTRNDKSCMYKSCMVTLEDVGRGDVSLTHHHAEDQSILGHNVGNSFTLVSENLLHQQYSSVLW